MSHKQEASLFDVTDVRPLFTMDDEYLHIDDDEQLGKLEKKKISASTMTSLLTGCPAKWAYSAFTPYEENDVTAANTKGSIFHKVMEIYYSLPQEKRTKQTLIESAKEVFAEWPDIQNHPDTKKWIQETINGFIKMSEDAKAVKIADIDTGNGWGAKKGLEVFVSGQINGVECLGFIDRVQELPDGTLRVEDWKTGKIKVYKKGGRNEEGLPEQRQQIMYSMLLENLGYHVSDARLIYPRESQHYVWVDVHDKELRERTVSDIETAGKALENYKQTNSFEMKPTFLCAWCPMVKMCSKATNPNVFSRSDKAMTSYNSQPDVSQLSRVVERR